ncbi:LamB/YcsF family protein, partial [Rhodococcus hoagii]|nr:LamB/YcsF family protein [Prescottella equi]
HPRGHARPRTEPGAVVHDPDVVAKRVLQLVTTGTIEAIDGTPIVVPAETICVHGDTPAAVAMAAAIRKLLDAEKIHVKPFV